MLVIRNPINSAGRYESAHVEQIDLVLPWHNLSDLLKDKDFISLTITTEQDQYVITKDSSW